MATEPLKQPLRSTAPSNFITIVEPEETVPWRWKNPDTGVVADTIFHLRLVPDDLQKVWKEQVTTRKWEHNRRTEDINWDPFTDECLDYAIVKWEGVRHPRTQQDLPCTREYKLLLPERIKAEIARLCVGKELGSVAGAGSSGEPAPDRS